MPQQGKKKQDIAQWHNRIVVAKRHVRAGHRQRYVELKNKKIKNKAREGKTDKISKHGDCWLFSLVKKNNKRHKSAFFDPAGDVFLVEESYWVVKNDGVGPGLEYMTINLV